MLVDKDIIFMMFKMTDTNIVSFNTTTKTELQVVVEDPSSLKIFDMTLGSSNMIYLAGKDMLRVVAYSGKV